ncbi:protein phosphatase CheZ, partial [Escherichia coli]
MRREIGADGFRELAKRVELFLARSERDGAKLSGHLNDILLAQDYQDLTGQVIKRVTLLVTDANGNQQTLTTTVNPDGTFSVDVVTPLADGAYTV